MAAKTSGKAGKSSFKKAGKKTSKKKPLKKKALKKRAAKKKKIAAKKKSLKKKTVRKALKKKPARKKAALSSKKEMVTIEPGPPTLSVPPVEEPAPNEEAIGTVTHYYSHLGVAVVQINKGVLRTGDTIRIKGHTTDFTQKIESMEYEHQHTDQAVAGQSVGLKVAAHAREHDVLYRVK
jgi:translation elongation factor EF-Tu-like GTPase